MADEAKEVAEAPAGQDKDKGKDKNSGGGPLIVILLSVAVMAVTSAAGLGAGWLLHKGPGPKTAEAAQNPPAGTPASEPTSYSDHAKYKYVDLPIVTASLNEERMSRYVRVVIKLAICEEDFSSVGKTIEEKQPELLNWLQVYLAGCTLEDVRGDKNLNRILRVINDEFNQRLWPHGRPLIHHTVFENGGMVIQ